MMYYSKLKPSRRGTPAPPWWRSSCFRYVVPLTGMLTACAPVRGYSDNPANEAAVQASLAPYFSPDKEEKYATLSGQERQNLRNTVVINRMRAYEIAFGDFERRLWGDANILSAGGDLLVLALAGLGATTGSTATSSALAAASAGIVGGQAAVNKDLYYQRTMPALLAQMEANRDKIKLAILQGLGKSDDQYSLYQADLDLDALQRASGIPGAVGDITQQATASKATAEAKLLEASSVVTEIPPDVAARRAKFAKYVKDLAKQPNNAKTLDAIAATLGTSRGSNATEERDNILLDIATTVKSNQDMDAVSAQLSAITNKEF